MIDAISESLETYKNNFESELGIGMLQGAVLSTFISLLFDRSMEESLLAGGIAAGVTLIGRVALPAARQRNPEAGKSVAVAIALLSEYALSGMVSPRSLDHQFASLSAFIYVNLLSEQFIDVF